MIGATAIEDKLQEGVPDAIRMLEDVCVGVIVVADVCCDDPTFTHPHPPPPFLFYVHT